MLQFVFFSPFQYLDSYQDYENEIDLDDEDWEDEECPPQEPGRHHRNNNKTCRSNQLIRDFVPENFF